MSFLLYMYAKRHLFISFSDLVNIFVLLLQYKNTHKMQNYKFIFKYFFSLSQMLTPINNKLLIKHRTLKIMKIFFT